MQIAYPPHTMPVLAEGDVLILGGSFAGIAAALEVARAGLKVVLVEPRTYLGREITATLRPWFEQVELEHPSTLPDLIQAVIKAAGSVELVNEIMPLRLAELKTAFEDMLLQNKVKIIYASLPVGLYIPQGQLQGVIIGNKSGRQLILAPRVVDTTETALTARLTGAAFQTHQDPARFTRALEFDHVGEIELGEFSIPNELEIPGDKIRLISGARGEGHLFVEFPLLLDANIQDASDWTNREIVARHKSMALIAHLLQHVPAFQKAIPASAAQLLQGPISPSLNRQLPTWAGEFTETLPANPYFPISHTVQELCGPLPGLFLLGDPIFVNEADRKALRSPVGAAFVGQFLGHLMADRTLLQPALTNEVLDNEKPKGPTPFSIQVKEPQQPQRGYPYPVRTIPEMGLPILREVEVLVAGGGTSGATAAAVAGSAGARTLLVELNPGLGGTGTFGGVHSYWFGRRVGFSHEVIEQVAASHADLGLDPPVGQLLKWNIEAKMDALLIRAERAHNEILWGAIVIGALTEGKRVRGMVVATPFGPTSLLSEVVIDATGDGDVAVFAGAEYFYGAERDHITMWYALAQFYRPGFTKNNFTSMVDVSNISDYTRAILAGRRRVEGYDVGTYIAPRESRHILGDVVLTLNDQLLKRCWPDVIYIAFSNHDVKGHTSSDWIRAGLIPPNLEVEVPFRALLPRGLEGILVTGKAISATHDAQPAVRMQPDMENLGGIAGLAAALAVETRCLPRQLNVRDIQKQLIAAKVLPEPILNRTLKSRQTDPQTLTALLGQLDPEKPLYTYQDMELDVVYEENIPIVELCCAGPQVVPELEKALVEANGKARLMIARALALVGSPAGVPDLIHAIHAETPDEGLQYRESHIRHANLPPDQGAAPDVVYLLYTLGMTRDPRALPVWEHFADLLAATSSEDIRDRNLGLFYYVDAICYGAERLGDPRAIPLLKRMYSNPMFQKRVSRDGFEPDFFLERQAYLELVIARTLARCGEPAGYATLITYLEDARALLAEHAHSELQQLTHQDFGKDARVWRNWFAYTKFSYKPMPIIEPNEPRKAWDEEILKCSDE